MLCSATATSGRESNADGSFTAIAGLAGNQTHFTDYGATYSSGIRNAYVTTDPAKLIFIPNAGSGSFQYYCSIHGGMVAYINVLPVGRTAPLTPAQVNATNAVLVAQLEAFAVQEIAAMAATAPKTGAGVSHTRLADGTNQWTVVGGAMWMNGNVSMFARFLPSYLEVNVNDTVTFVTMGDGPHYVYFNINNTWPALYANWSDHQTTPVSATYSRVNTAYYSIGPSANANVTYPNAAGIVNSGLIFDAMAGIPIYATAYSVKFVQAGTFPYQCQLHLDIGMIASVVVKPAGAALCTDPANASTCAVAAAVVTPVSVRGDPQFVGLLGQSYQVHGIDGAVYSIISEREAQVNARFSFLTGPRACPTVQQAWSESEPATAIQCWSHDGSYLSELALFTPSARLFIQAGTAAEGFAAVQFNATSASASTGLVYQQLSTHHLTVTLGSFTLHIDNSDGFVNIATVKPLVPLSQLSAHGLLGQTYVRRGGSSGKRGGAGGVIEGEVDDYVVDGGLFAVDAMYNRYGVTQQ